MDIATLGLTVNNAEANAAIDATGAKLDALGARGERAAALQATAVKRVAREYQQLNSGDLAAASKWYDQVYGSAGKAATATEKVAASATHATGGFGRLNYSMGSLVTRMAGISPVFGRLGSLMGNFAVGGMWTAAFMIGLAAIMGAWKLLGHQADELADKVSAAMKKMHAETLTAQLAMGDLQLAKARADIINAQSGLTDASKVNYDAKTGLANGTEGNVGKAQKALAVANAELFDAQQNKSRIDYQMKGEGAKNYAENLAMLIKSNNATAAERQRGLALYRSDVAEIAALGKSQTDNVRRAQLIQESTSLKDAFNPKGRGSAGHAVHAPKIPDVRSAVVISTIDQYAAQYNQLVREADNRAKGIGKSSMSGVKSDLLAGGGPLQNIVDHAKVLQALGPSKELDRVTAAAEKMGKAEISELAKSNLGWAEKARLIAEVKRQMAGLSAPQDWSKMSTSQKIESSMRSGADAANLFGGARGAQWGNILNTAANATENTVAAVSAGGMNPIADAQAALSIASLGKQIFGLGSQSHATKDRINEANNALRDTMSISSDIINHNPLQAMLDANKQTYDQLYASINSVLPGLKNQTLRNQDLAAAQNKLTYDNAQSQAQFTLDSSNFDLSMKARKDAAMGLTFNAAKENLQIRQASERFAVEQKYGVGSTQDNTLKLVQNTEMLRLVNQSLTQVANAPTGFFAENYASSFVTRQAAPTSGGSTSGGGITFNGPVTISLPISTSTDPVTHAKEVVKGIRQFGNATGGINVPVAQTMELM